MAFVPTHYKPTIRQGKRVLYRSTDPDEPKWESRSKLKVILGVTIFLVILVLLSYWKSV